MAETQDVTLPVLAAVSKLDGACFWRQNTGMFRTMDGDRIVRATSVNGGGDIMGCFLTKAIAIETKVRKGKQRATQVNFQKRWQAAGGVYIIARCPEEAVRKLEELFQ